MYSINSTVIFCDMICGYYICESLCCWLSKGNWSWQTTISPCSIVGCSSHEYGWPGHLGFHVTGAAWFREWDDWFKYRVCSYKCSPCFFVLLWWGFNSLRPKWNRCHFTNDIFKCNFLNEKVLIFIKISLKFISKGSINNIPTLVQISEPMVVSLLLHLCIYRPQWVNWILFKIISLAIRKCYYGPNARQAAIFSFPEMLIANCFSIKYASSGRHCVGSTSYISAPSEQIMARQEVVLMLTKMISIWPLFVDYLVTLSLMNLR